MRWFFRKFIIFCTIVFFVFLFFYFNAGPRVKNPQFGMTFSPRQAESLNLNWKEVYIAMVNELPQKSLRLMAYWDQVQPKENQYNFSDLDYMLDLAAQKNIQVTLAVGQRLPRWPECFMPDWAKKNPNQNVKNNAQLSYVETVVNRYKNHQAIFMWQVENEAFLSTFGECPKLDKNFFDQEIALVKKLDPSRPILITDSGELSLWWQAGKRGDIFGTTLYRYVFSDVFKRYWVNYIPFWFYRVKAGLLRMISPDKVVLIAELQAEPWTKKGIINTPIEEQFKTISLDKFNNILQVARATGFSPQYLWGVEWWYYMKQKGHPEFWEKVKKL